ncbi:efflux RND transporter periplasmic adaptor subunit [bacterium]|nr:efflux RND transporter periplasmic adaptor subunit [bacterium]
MNVNWKKIIKYVVIVAIIIVGGRTLLTRDKIKTIPVKTVTIRDRTITKTVAASGEIKSNQDAELAFGVAGKVQKIYVEKGEVVEKGTLLAMQDNYGAAQSVQSYKDARDIALRDRELFIENYETNLEGYGGKDEYLIALRGEDEAVSKAEATYQSHLATLQNTYLYAPFSGTIVDVYLKGAETAAATTVVLKISDEGDRIFEIDVDQEDFGLLKEDQEVEVELDAYDKHIFNGKVSKLPTYANGGDSPSFTIEITLDAVEDKEPLLGMTGDAHIIVDKMEMANSLFYDEVFYDEEDKPFVWVLDNDLIVKHPVETGLEGDIYTQITTSVDKTIVVGLNDDVEMKEGYKAKISR